MHDPSLAYPETRPDIAKPERYRELRSRVAALLEGERDWLANLANAAAEIFAWLPGLNWAGFYLMRGGELVLGPFQGRPACVRIAVGRGVCGAAAETRTTQVVADVHAFPGHIACDPRSRSEIVVPIVVPLSVPGGDPIHASPTERVVGVLDLDADRPDRFDDEDRAGLEGLVADILPLVDWDAATRV
jgi:L-methionine (R)-S-oxide reductase